MNIEGSGFRWDLIRPCKHCPFRTDETAIRFRCRERAAEIEESAYRNGFPCHEHADHVEEDDYQGGLVASPDGTTQHCAGAMIMYAMDGGGNVPFEWLDEDDQDRILARLDYTAPVFDNPDAFLDANTDGGTDE